MEALNRLVQQWRQEATACIETAIEAEGKGLLVTSASQHAEGGRLKDCADQLEALCVVQGERQEEKTQTRGDGQPAGCAALPQGESGR